MAKGDICSILNCIKVVRVGIICENHRWCFKKYGSYTLPDRTIIKICRAPGCESPVDKKQASRLCVMHRVRWSRHKSFDLPVKPDLPDGIVKICKIHGELTNEQAYTNDNYASYQCLDCKKIAMDKFEELNPDRDSNLLKKYIYIAGTKFKILKSEYKKMHDLQYGVCKICKRPESILKGNSIKNIPKKLSIDHCHEVEKIGILKVRGLLCGRCNTIIGCTKDKNNLTPEQRDYLNASK